MIWKTKKYSELTLDELYSILQLRNEVFIVEQNCPYQDLDGKDRESYHLFAEQNGVMVAYARLLPKGLSYPEPSIGRVVVKETFRGDKLGVQLMLNAIAEVKRIFTTEKITISAQLYLKKFYNSLGFKEEGEVYPEDDIPHIKMKYGN